MTLHTDVALDAAAQCPRLMQFLGETFQGDAGLIDFAHRAVGYSLSGDTSDQCLFLCHGEGSNGKSTFLETLRMVFGGYALNLPFSAFELKARSNIPNDIATLPGRRFVTAIETSESVRLNESRVKALTGSDTITARLLYKEFFQFSPTAKFWLAFNHKPRVADDSYGFWRRIRLIPFLRKFEGERVDKSLLDKLRAEAPGILAWAIRGCLAWQKEGLAMPTLVKAATESYRQESDALGQFIDDCCVIHPEARVTVANLWQVYVDWTRESGERWPLDRASFAERLEKRGFQKKRHGHKRDWTWFGICRRVDASAQGIPLDADTRADADANSRISPITPPV